MKTAQAFGVYAQTAVTAITVQDTEKVRAVHALSPALVRAQIDAALQDIGADVIKIGMLANGQIAASVADALDMTTIKVVLDPVLRSSSGAELLDKAGQEILKQRLIGRAMLVTPNVPETEALTGSALVDQKSLYDAAATFKRMGASSVLFKGGHGKGEILEDVLWSDGRFSPFEVERQNTPHTHGTGCTLATAIACGLAQNLPLQQSVRRAQLYVQEAMRTAPGLGLGHGPLNQMAGLNF